MLPIYIICHADCVPSSYLCAYLDKRNILYKKVNAINNDISALDLRKAAGLIVMGGPYSANDNLPWLNNEIKLIKQAIEKDLLMMGVCFGAQIISRALGAQVSRAEYMETGWHKVETDTSKLTEPHLLKLEKTIEVFEWHEEVFSIPAGATPIFSGHNHENQGYLLGKILAMQFHLEMTEHMVHDWLERYQHCMPEASQSVQNHEQMTERLAERLENMHVQADKIYDWWLNML